MELLDLGFPGAGVRYPHACSALRVTPPFTAKLQERCPLCRAVTEKQHTTAWTKEFYLHNQKLIPFALWNYKDLLSGRVSEQDHMNYASASLKQQEVKTTPTFPYGGGYVSRWVTDNPNAVLVWSSFSYLPWHVGSDKMPECKTKTQIGSYWIFCLV